MFCYFNLLKETFVSLVAKHFTVSTSSVFLLSAVGQVTFNGILEIFHRKDLSAGAENNAMRLLRSNNDPTQYSPPKKMQPWILLILNTGHILM